MPRGIPKNKVNVAEELEQEIGLHAHPIDVVATVEDIQTTKELNTFDDDYTLKVLAEFDPAADVFRIPNKDKNFEYRWLRDDPERISVAGSNLLHQQGGWELCPKKHTLRIGFLEREISADGYVRRGKNILSFMPLEQYQKKEEWKKKKAVAPLDKIKRLMKDGRNDPELAKMHETMVGIQNAKNWK